MKPRSTCILLLALTTLSSSALAQPIPGSDDGTRSPSKPAPSEPEEETAPATTPTAEPADEAEVEEEPRGLDPSRPPAAGKGVVWGVVKSKGSSDTLLEAIVSVIGSKDYSTTDVDGRYRLELRPGTYQLRVVYELHKPARIKNVVVRAGKVAKVDVALQADETAVEEVTAIEAEAERASAATQLMLRKNAAQSSDSIGAQDIARTPDRNAAEAVKRVVGTTVVDGKYIFVRGLGERYTNTLLNGSPLPSPEPDRQAVPLDMFPTLVISDLTVSKTFVPDMPGDFTGGSLNIHTRDLPNKFFLQGSLGLGFNTVSTFGHRLSSPGGSTDWLGFDDGGRKLPSSVPANRVTRLLSNGRRNPALTQIGRDINGEMATERAFNLPHGSANVVAGDSFKLGKERVLGYIVGATYSRRFQKRVNETNRTFSPDGTGGLRPQNDYTFETGIDTVTWSTLGSLSYAFDKDHKVSFTGLYNRNAEKEGRSIAGFNEEQSNQIQDERIRFLNRGLALGQLRGEHRFRSVNVATLTWTGMFARASLDDPNLRETVYVNDPTTGFAFRDSTESGQHFYAKQHEDTFSLGLDWLQPLSNREGAPKLKGGGLVVRRSRQFNARRFRFIRLNEADPATFRQTPNSLFVDGNVGSALELEEWTRPTDAYTAHYDTYAGYLMGDVEITPRLRVVVGERVESSKQDIDSFDPFGANPNERVRTDLSKLDLLPSANVILKVTKESNLRLSATRTVARPQLRELAPFIFTEFLGARSYFGNPDLDRTRIVNLDARFELFPRVSEVLALSVFHKRFDKPIEPFVIPTGRGVLSYQNAPKAANTGVEVEARKGLDFIADPLKEFSLLGNVAFIHSRVELDPAGGTQTSTDRPLAGQSPYVINLAIAWAHDKSKTRARVLYNVQGKRLAEVGNNGLPDAYEQPRNIVDLSIAQGFGEHVDLKLTIENILDAPVRFTQGPDSTYVMRSYNLGQTAWLLATITN